MRSLFIILACGIGPMGGLTLEQAKCLPSSETASCCCCPKGTVCQCRCGATKDTPIEPASPPPIRLMCSCDSMPYGPLPSDRFHVLPLKIIEILTAVQDDIGTIVALPTRAAWATAQRPPPDLPLLRTIILNA